MEPDSSSRIAHRSRGKAERLSSLFDSCYSRFARYAYVRTGDRAEAEDIAFEVFLYVDAVDGLPIHLDVAIEIKLPSNKLLLTLEFRIGHDDHFDITDYAFDITVIRAGNSDQYLLKPQPGQNGPDQPYRLLEHTSERIQIGRPAWAASPKWSGKPRRVFDNGDGDDDGNDGLDAI